MPLVAFGHMHEKLRGTSSLRNMVEVDAATGTIYLNTAVVPRVRSKTIKGCEVRVTWVSCDMEAPIDSIGEALAMGYLQYHFTSV